MTEAYVVLVGKTEVRRSLSAFGSQRKHILVFADMLAEKSDAVPWCLGRLCMILVTDE
jgi:hypothetical protein